ncbi:MAG: alpha/beta fold hydrolase [Candidatus Binatia bacterium]
MSEPWTHQVRAVNGFRMHYVTAGSGYPLVFLHGWPQTWYEWRKIIPSLAERFTIIAPDLRGLGDSEKPITGYDKRTLADDVYQLTHSLGYEKFGLIGHDWGGTVAYYLACDHPQRVERLLIFESTPGLARENEEIPLAGIRRLWHVFFHGGNPDLAELLVRDHLEVYLERMYSVACYNPALFTQAELAEYIRAYAQPGALRAGFHYYRAALEEDVAALTRCTEKLPMPVRAWGGARFMGDILPLWKRVADEVQGGVIDRCGHFVAEERPDFVLQQVHEFFEPFSNRSRA